MQNYRKRIADQILCDKLEAKGAVLIEGPNMKSIAGEKKGNLS